MSGQSMSGPGGGRRTALLVHVEEFAERRDEHGEPDLFALGSLPFAGRVRRLREQLTRFGYEVREPADRTSAGIAAAVEKLLDEHGADDVVLVHVLSHGEPDGHNGGYYVLGEDGVRDFNADAGRWLDRAEASTGRFTSHRDRPYALFLLDLCFAGRAVAGQWRTGGTPDGRAYAICAAADHQKAYNARFTEALTDVFGVAAALAEFDPYDPDGILPLDVLTRELVKNINELEKNDLADPQDVVTTPVSLGANRWLPFFPVRGVVQPDSWSSSGDRSPISSDLRSFLLSGSVIPGTVSEVEGLFTGRVAELARLAAWLADPTAAPVHLVTGAPGAGVSTLLAHVVRHAHPELRAELGVDPGVAVPGTAELVAVNLAGADLPQAVDAIGRQLVGHPVGGHSETLVNAVLGRARPVTLVLDGLDQAVDPPAVEARLLRPLASGRNTSGGPACRMLIGAHALRGPFPATMVTTDLDAVDPADLLAFLELLGEREGRTGPQWTAFARAAAEALAADSPAADSLAADSLAVDVTATDRFGAYLAAAVHGRAAASGSGPTLLGTQLSRAMTVVWALELAGPTGSWARPVATALAWAEGDGIPIGVLRCVAIALAAGTSSGVDPLTPERVAAVLHELRRYLTISQSADGRVYRLRHPALVRALRADADAPAVLEGIYRAVGEPGRAPAWRYTTAYARRRVLDHAVAAGRHRELLGNAAFLIENAGQLLDAQGDGRLPPDETAVAALAVARRARELDLIGARENARFELAVVAARHGAHDLARGFAELPGEPALSWRPRWLAGTSRPATGHPPGLDKLILVTVEDGEVVAYDAGSGQLVPGAVAGHQRGVTALSAGGSGTERLLVSVAGRSVQVTSAPGGAKAGSGAARNRVANQVAVVRWRDDLVIAAVTDRHMIECWTAKGDTYAEPLDCGRPLWELILADDGSRVLAVTLGGDNWVDVWALESGRRVLPPRPGQAATVVVADGRTYLVVVDGWSTAHTYRIADGQEVAMVPLPRRTSHLRTVRQGDDPLVAMAAGEDLIGWNPLENDVPPRPIANTVGRIEHLDCVSGPSGSATLVASEGHRVTLVDLDSGHRSTVELAGKPRIRALVAVPGRGGAPARTRPSFAVAAENAGLFVAVAGRGSTRIAHLDRDAVAVAETADDHDDPHLDWLRAGPLLLLRRTAPGGRTSYVDARTGAAVPMPATGLPVSADRTPAAPAPVVTVVDGRVVVVTAEGSGALLVHEAEEKAPYRITIQDSPPVGLAPLPGDPEVVVVGYRNGALCLVNLRTRQEIDRVETPGPIRHLTVRPGPGDSAWVVVEAGAEVLVLELTRPN
ncbi:MAG TPA: caspase family protein [Actinoplanes sp.]|jgi:hypothetical protein|nr:caspase family protein [Actinoplanes sp.]